MVSHEQLNEIADKYFGAIVAHDYDALEPLLSKNGVCDKDGQVYTFEVFRTALEQVKEAVGDHVYEDAKRVIGTNAIVEEHRARTTDPAREGFDMWACVVLRTDDDGLIIQMDEYLDSAAYNQTAQTD